MDATPELVETLTRLSTPGAAELLEAREVILETLADGKSHHERDLSQAFRERRSIADVGYHEPVVLNWIAAAWTEPTGNEPALAGIRVDAAVHQGLAGLAREQVIVPIEGNIHGAPDLSINVQQVRGNSTTGSVRIPRTVEQLPGHGDDCRWRLLHAADHPRSQLAKTSMPDGLEDLLGVRGAEVLREAVSCFHAGRFIAAVDLLAAASEAAWFGVAAAAPGVDTRLDKLVAAHDGAADVIRRTAGVIATKVALPALTGNEVHARAVYLRDLRNYGLHPVGAPDEAHEPAFTEAGAAAVFMAAPRYFQHLESARVALAAATTSPT